MTGLETSRFLELAYKEGMTTPEYVYLTSSRDVTEYTLEPWADKLDGLEPAEAKFKKDNIYSCIKSVSCFIFIATFIYTNIYNTACPKRQNQYIAIMHTWRNNQNMTTFVHKLIQVITRSLQQCVLGRKRLRNQEGL